MHRCLLVSADRDIVCVCVCLHVCACENLKHMHSRMRALSYTHFVPSLPPSHFSALSIPLPPPTSTLTTCQDTIALMFLLELNNLLMWSYSPDSCRWKVKVSNRCCRQMEWCRNWFHRVFCVLIVVLVGTYMVLMFDWENAAVKVLVPSACAAVMPFEPYRPHHKPLKLSHKCFPTQTHTQTRH